MPTKRATWAISVGVSLYLFTISFPYDPAAPVIVNVLIVGSAVVAAIGIAMLTGALAILDLVVMAAYALGRFGPIAAATFVGGLALVIAIGLDAPDPLPSVPLLAVGGWILVLVERRVRRSNVWFGRRLTDLAAVVLVALFLRQLVHGDLLTVQPAAGLFFLVGLWLCHKLWRAMHRSRRLLVRAGADIVFAFLLGVAAAMLVVWLANVLQLSPGQVEVIRTVLDRTKAVTNVHWAYWLVGYLLLATASFATLYRPTAVARWTHRLRGELRQWYVDHVVASAAGAGPPRGPAAIAQAKRIVNEELPHLLESRARQVSITGRLDVGRRVLSGLNLGLLAALLFGVAGSVAVTPLAREPIDARYTLEIQRQRELAGQIAAYTEIRRRFTNDPPPAETLRAIVIAVFLIEPPPTGRAATATRTQLHVARQVGRFQSDAVAVPAVEPPPVPDPPVLDEIGSHVERLRREQRTTELSHGLANRFAHEAAVAVASTLQIPNVGEAEAVAVQIIREYLAGLIEDGPLKNLFYAWGRRLATPDPRLDVDTIVTPNATQLRSAAHAATAQAADLADAELPASTSGQSDVEQAVQLANQYRYLHERTGPCPGCAKAGDRGRDMDRDGDPDAPDIHIPRIR